MRSGVNHKNRKLMSRPGRADKDCHVTLCARKFGSAWSSAFDIAMLSMDGFPFFRQVRAGHSCAVAIALSALGRAQDRMDALRAGYIAYPVKPIELVELAATVAAVLGRPAP